LPLPEKRIRVGVVGAAGGVGSATAFALVLARAVSELVLIDLREGPLASHVMDLEQLRGELGPFEAHAGTVADAAACDVLIVSASVAHRDGLSRMAYLEANARVVASVADALERAGTTPRTIVATNPVDPLCTWLHRRLEWPRERILGYTLNDSTRLRSSVADALGVAPAAVEAFSLGEHGDHPVLLFDRISVDGERVQLASEQRSDAERSVRTWYERWQWTRPGRTSTWMSARGLTRMACVVAAGCDEIWPTSMLLAGEYGVEGVSLTVPVRFAPDPVVLEWPLAERERAAFAAGAEVVAQAAAAVEAATGIGAARARRLERVGRR
jgi:malate dehydrogenase